MKWFPKRIASWVEPVAYLNEQDRIEQENWPLRRKLKWMLFVAIGILPAWFIAHFNPENEPPPWYWLPPLCLLAGWCFVFLIPWIAKRSKSQVYLFEDRLAKMRANQITTIVFSKVTAYSVAVRDNFWVFCFKREKHATWKVAVPDAQNRDLLVSTLFAAGVSKATS